MIFYGKKKIVTTDDNTKAAEGNGNFFKTKFRRCGNFNRDFAGSNLCNDEVKDLCRAAWGDEENFFKNDRYKRKITGKLKVQKEKEISCVYRKHTKNNPFRRLICDFICIVI